MAASTLTNPTNAHHLFPKVARVFPLPDHPEGHPQFRVFPTGESEYHWRIVVLASNQTISRHKSLAIALSKCSSLNQQRSKTQLDPLKSRSRPVPDFNSCRTDCEGARK